MTELSIERPRIPPLRFAAVVLTALFLVGGCLEAYIFLSAIDRPSYVIGYDFHIYMERAASFVAGDGFYRANQLAGPYVMSGGDAMYPPTILYLLVPFLYLPAVLWWAIPLALIAWGIRRAPWWAWPMLAALLVYPRTWNLLVFGNPAMWIIAALAVGWYGFAVLKPTLAIFALPGIRDRRTWVTFAVLAIATLPLPWRDYIDALRYATSPFGLDYLLGEIPIAAVVVVATWRR